MRQKASEVVGAKAVGSARLRAAQYVRMSTEHQQYSTENQSDVILRYGEENGMDIVRTYADDGKSGVSIAGRAALKRLIADVESGAASFDVILVYDVSRWGRFQDADESAYYEYLCKRANIAVHYCAEPFANDGSLSSTLLKTIKRTMAGEFSRELSVKVFAGQCRLTELGFRQGGVAGYGLRRLLVDQNRNPKSLLAQGERKSIQTDRVILVHGPKEEVAVVREIFSRFTEQRQGETSIAEILNSRSLTTHTNRHWSAVHVHRILTYPKYMGSNVYNRRSYRLKTKAVSNPPEMWVSRDLAFEPIISPEVFRRAQEIMAKRCIRFSNDEMLEFLRRLLAQKGFLSAGLIDETDGIPSSSDYRRRFKGLTPAYKLIGYVPRRNPAYLDVTKVMRECHQEQTEVITNRLNAIGASVRIDPETNLLTVNEEFTVLLVVGRCRQYQIGKPQWLLRLKTSLAPDITIVARLRPGNQSILDYYLLPGVDAPAERFHVGPVNRFPADVYRFDDLSFFFSLANRRTIEEAE